ncbi:hypothetical protein [Rhodoferax sp.]|uniref:hypothetical protein n=1 Tax=Rhodoferax sp. TaxID=50421 RepID=UPI00374DD960
MSFVRLTRPAGWIAGLVLLGCSVLASPAQAQAVAVVTNVKGLVHLAPGNKSVSLLSELAPGADVTLEPGALLSFVYLQSGTEFQLSGPARATVGAAAPQSVSGASAVPRSSVVAAETVKLQTTNGRVVLGGMVMRGPGLERLKLIEPTGKVLSARPGFAWSMPAEVAVAQFELREEGSDKILLSTPVPGSQLVLADGVALQPGVNYLWTVSIDVPGANSLARSSYFSLPGAQERERIEALRPGPQAPFSDRLIFASLLEQGRFLSESRKLWQQLAQERPDLPELRNLANK